MLNGYRLVVEQRGEAFDAALLLNDKLEQRWRYHPDHMSRQFFKARVTKINKDIDGAFTDLGRSGLEGFVSGRDLVFAANDTGSKKRSIGSKCHEGSWLTLEAIREASEDKGVRLTGKIRIQGRFCSYAPFSKGIAYSKWIRGAKLDLARERFKELDLPEGLSLKRLALDVEQSVILREVMELQAYWTACQAKDGKAGLLKPFINLKAGLIWQILDYPITSIALNQPGLITLLKRILEELPEAARPELEILPENTSPYEASGVQEEIELLTAREIPLHGGGRLIIEPTAAFTAVDVDSAGRKAMEVDLEAANEIARQCRLRNIAGHILVDFIDLPTRPQRQRLDEALKSAFKDDPASVQVYAMNNLGIVAISRSKRGQVWNNQAIAKPCPTCNGSGVVAIG